MYKGVIFDFDGTVADSVKAYCDYYNELFKERDGFIKADPRRVNKWNFEDECPLAVSCCEEMFGEKGFFNELELFPNVGEVIVDLYNQNVNTAICSIGTKMNLHHKTKWIRDTFDCFIPNLVLLSNEGVKMDKSIVNMDGYVFFDDHLGNLLSSNASFKVCYGKKFPWNQDWKGLWAKDWDDVRRILVSIGVLKY